MSIIQLIIHPIIQSINHSQMCPYSHYLSSHHHLIIIIANSRCQSCDLCVSDSTSSAVSHCNECSLYLCAFHVEAHKRTRGLCGHTLISVDDLKRSISVFNDGVAGGFIVVCFTVVFCCCFFAVVFVVVCFTVGFCCCCLP